jgi:hypothetical protein
MPLGEGYSVEASLITKDGELLHRAQQLIRIAGVLSEVDENAADFDSDLADADRSVEVSFGATSDPVVGAGSRALWGRLFGR